MLVCETNEQQQSIVQIISSLASHCMDSQCIMELKDQQNRSKLMRLPNLKRNQLDENPSNKMNLERVLGVTVGNNAALASDPVTGTLAYPAGCTVVLFNWKTGKQSFLHTSKRTITSLAFSKCGRYLLTGECGRLPALRVWDLQADQGYKQMAELTGHKFAVVCAAFSPNSKLVISVGTQHDMIVNVWDWRNGNKIASNKVSSKVRAVAFSQNGKYFVTVGNRHVKFWYLDWDSNKFMGKAAPLTGRSAILGEHCNNEFVDVACGLDDFADSTYAITQSGLLCEFNNRRLLNRWIELRTVSANCLSMGPASVFVGCADGIIRCFDPRSLSYVTTLPRPHCLGVDVAMGTDIKHISKPPPDAKYPDVIAITYDRSSAKIGCVYNDHSVYLWDVNDVRRVGKTYSALYHSACIWDIEMVSTNAKAFLPPGSFLTCSSDDTVRLWSLDSDDEISGNIYSKELYKVLYVDNESLKDTSVPWCESKKEKSFDGRNGVRTIEISPDGTHIAIGDRSGNIRIYATATMEQLLLIEAHNSEVLSLAYGLVEDRCFFASCSRDRLVHIFDVGDDYRLVQTLSDHGSAVTSVRFFKSFNEGISMVTCGVDKRLIFRAFDAASSAFQTVRNVVTKTPLYDMDIDRDGKHVVTACQDRNLRVYKVSALGKHTKSFRGAVADTGSLIRIALDPSGMYLATSCTDKSLAVWDYYTGECMASVGGHSEVATTVAFTNDCKRLISVGGDGCVFVWSVPQDMVVTMQARLSQQALRSGRVESPGADMGNIESLPKWARRHFMEVSPSVPDAQRAARVAMPKGRWAERMQPFDQFELLPRWMQNRLPGDGGEDVDSPPASSSANQFTVISVDANELRKSVRSKKKPKIILSAGQQSEDSDDASSLSEENFSASTESLDKLDRRDPEKYLVSSTEDLTVVHKGRRSLSSQFAEMIIGPNEINTSSLSKNKEESYKKRDELNRLVASTKLTLQKMGHKSMTQLPITNEPTDNRTFPAAKDYVPLESSSLRKACSLNDLSECKTPRSSKIRAGSLSTKKLSTLYSPLSTRSQSSNVLNVLEDSSLGFLSRLTRSTISSRNKSVGNEEYSTPKAKMRSNSISNLNYDSSSEDTEGTPTPNQLNSVPNESGKAVAEKLLSISRTVCDLPRFEENEETLVEAMQVLLCLAQQYYDRFDGNSLEDPAVSQRLKKQRESHDLKVLQQAMHVYCESLMAMEDQCQNI